MLAAPRQPRPTTFTNRQVANLFFWPCRDQYDEVILEYFRCTCGAVRKCATGTGYTNLMQHIRREHPAFAEEMLAATPGETGSVVHYVRHSAQNTCGWLELLIKCNLPLSFCESKLARRYSNIKPISVQTLRRVLDAVTRAVERSIAAEMRERFGLVEPCLRALRRRLRVVRGGRRGPLPSTLHGSTRQCGVRRSVGRNAPSYPERGAVAGLQQTTGAVPLPCRRQLFRQPPPRYAHGRADADATNLKPFRKITTEDDPRPIIRQQTRWVSTFAMLNRYFELLPFLDTEDEAITELLPSAGVTGLHASGYT
ncbi:hypothetical protein PC120_g4914 [Phytophthora cactorum]|nr:hypothetical protein PC120_g4914 [Phytophthora cactorum]